MNKRTDTNALALSISIAMSILYSLCAAFLAFLPNIAVKLTSAVHHFSEEALARNIQITLPSYLIGLATTFVCTYLTVLLAVYIYEMLAEKKGH